MEQWKEIPGYEGLYEVSDHGRVKSVSRKLDAKGREHIKGGRRAVIEKILSPSVHRYCTVSLSKGGIVETAQVHRLVLIAFVGPCPKGMLCRHFPDRSTTNNRLDNLSWGTNAENRDDMIVHETRYGWGKRFVISEVKDEEIRNAHSGGEVVTRYQKGNVTQRKLAERYGVSLSTINKIIRGKK